MRYREQWFWLFILILVLSLYAFIWLKIGIQMGKDDCLSQKCPKILDEQKLIEAEILKSKVVNFLEEHKRYNKYFL